MTYLSNRGKVAATLNIRDLIGENCMIQKAGQAVFESIYPELLAGRPVELDFTDVKGFLSVFFNFAIGQLLKDPNIKGKDLDRLLTVSNLNPLRQQVYENVVLDNAKRYYSGEDYRAAVDAAIAEQSAYV
jgi:hypothetical protein